MRIVVHGFVHDQLALCYRSPRLTSMFGLTTIIGRSHDPTGRRLREPLGDRLPAHAEHVCDLLPRGTTVPGGGDSVP